jgi:hypothetical protein
MLENRADVLDVFCQPMRTISLPQLVSQGGEIVRPQVGRESALAEMVHE